MGLDDALRAKGDRFVGILNGLDTASGTPRPMPTSRRPTSRADPAASATCRADLLQRLGFDPDDDGAVLGMIGRLDPQKGFDLLAGAAPRLLAGGARIVVQGSGDPATRGRVPRAGRPAAGPGRAHRALRSGNGPPDLRRRRLLPDAVAVRAVRHRPDDLASIRHAADRPTDRRPRRHGHRRDDASGRGDRASCSTTRRRARSRPRASAAIAPARGRRHRPGRRLIERGMAVDFDWDRGLSAPLRSTLRGARSPSARKRWRAARQRRGDRIEAARHERQDRRLGAVRIGECGAPGIVMTFSAPMRATNAASAASGTRPPAADLAADEPGRRTPAAAGSRAPRGHRPSRRSR